MRLSFFQSVLSTVLDLAGLGCIDYGLFRLNEIAGWLGLGIALLIVSLAVDRDTQEE